MRVLITLQEIVMRIYKGLVLAAGIALICACSGNYEKRHITKDLARPNVVYAGMRSSSYGIRPFPGPGQWQSAADSMVSWFPGSQPCAVWIVGTMHRPDSCFLQFPDNGVSCTNTAFDTTDRHEPYLDWFDSCGVKVFLQVEPGSADVITLMDAVMRQYGHHQCVVGFGVDVEWFRESECKGWGVPVTDRQAEQWESHLKHYNDRYRLFLKHWDRKWMPETYRGDIIFITDSQILKNFRAMHKEFTLYWADYFKPNMVGFQIGYGSDRKWWGTLDVPPRDIGVATANSIEQQCCVFWVDFTLREVFPHIN